MVDIEELRRAYKPDQGKSFAANAVMVLCDEVEALRHSLEDMVYHFASWCDGGFTTRGLSVLEEAFEFLGWEDPHWVESAACDEPGCRKKITGGWQSETGWRNTCSDHWRSPGHDAS